jgi:hypothetical protein
MLTTLLSVLGVHHAQSIVGDLHEERALRRQEHPGFAADRWYVWQLSRLLTRSFAGVLLSTVIVAAPPIALLQGGWAALYGYFCLDPAPGLLQVNAAFVLAGSMLVSPARRIPVAALTIIGLVLALLGGSSTYPLLVAGMLAIPVGLLSAQLRKAST